MKNDISSIKIIKLDGLYFKTEFLKSFKSTNNFAENAIFDVKSGEVIIECGVEQEIKGIIEGQEFKVTGLHLYGKGSGVFWREVMVKMLSSSMGVFDALFVWNNGENISRISVIDGVLKQNEIKL